jgi:hypothetical protein
MKPIPDDFLGIILYDIEKNSCLNGVYTNIPEDGIIYNEICLRKTTPENLEDGIVGDYDCQWFENGNSYHRGDLNIRRFIKLVNLKSIPIDNIYTFNWFEKRTKNKYEGVGYKMNDRQIAVTYWQLP